MSQSFTFDNTKKPVASHDVIPSHQLPGHRPLVVQQTPQSTEPSTAVQRKRMARLDAGVMRQSGERATRPTREPGRVQPWINCRGKNVVQRVWEPGFYGVSWHPIIAGMRWYAKVSEPDEGREPAKNKAALIKYKFLIEEGQEFDKDEGTPTKKDGRAWRTKREWAALLEDSFKKYFPSEEYEPGRAQDVTDITQAICDLKKPDPEKWKAVLKKIQEAGYDVRRQVVEGLRGKEYQKAVPAEARTALMAALLEGSLYWELGMTERLKKEGVRGSGRTAYRRWVREEDSAERPALGSMEGEQKGSMNCWEAVLYAANLAGVLDDSTLREYEEAALEAVDKTPENEAGGEKDKDDVNEAYARVYAAKLGYAGAKPLGDADVPKGHLVYFSSKAAATWREKLTHVTIATGVGNAQATEVMSLWNEKDRNTYAMRRTTVGSLLKYAEENEGMTGLEVRHGRPGWAT